MWLGVTEYLFCKPALLDEVIKTAIEDNTFRSDDLEFTFAARVSHLAEIACLALLSSNLRDPLQPLKSKPCFVSRDLGRTLAFVAKILATIDSVLGSSLDLSALRYRLLCLCIGTFFSLYLSSNWLLPIVLC